MFETENIRQLNAVAHPLTRAATDYDPLMQIGRGILLSG
jgi:hypothetical protein